MRPGKTIARLLVVSLLAQLSITITASAKGMFDHLEVYGGGQAVVLSDTKLLEFESFNRFAEAYPGTPSVYNPGYLIVRLGLDQRTGEAIAIDSLRLFPADAIQSKAFVYYEGLVNGWSEYDAQWYEADAQAAALLERLAAVQDGAPWSLLAGWALTGLLLLIVAGLGLSRRSAQRSQAGDGT